jgi:hypothetical protein
MSMTESRGAGGGSDQAPDPGDDDPFAGFFRKEEPKADPSAKTDVVKPPLTWGPAPAQMEQTQQQWPQPQQQRPSQGELQQKPDVQPPPAPETWLPGGVTPGVPYPDDRTGLNPVIRPSYDDADDDWNALRQEQPPKKSKKKAALVAGGSLGTLAILAAVGVLLTQNGGITASLAGRHTVATPTPTTGFTPSATTAAGDVTETAQAFFTAWTTGDYKVAANYTDDPAEALTEMQAYQADLGTSSITITPGTEGPVPIATPGTSTSTASGTSSAGAGAGAGAGTGATASSTSTAAPTTGIQNFSVSAAVTAPAVSSASSAAGGAGGASSDAPSAGASTTASATASAGASASTTPATATWTYSSALTAYEQNSRWYIKWTPSILAPNLSATEHLGTLQIAPGADKVTDADGNSLAGSSDVGIQNIVSYLKAHVPTGAGTVGVGVELVDSATGAAIPGTAATIKPAVNAPSITTTIDPHVESLAEAAVQRRSGSSLVVVRPSTGAILAVANNDSGKDDALASREAPGSTMKIVTATALFNYGVLTPSSPDACPPTVTIQGVVYHNSTGDLEPPGTPFLVDFAASCNNAFDSEYTNLENLRLEGTAANTYGLNQPWNIGLGPSTYFSMPTDSGDESGSELAQEAFGQGKVSASPLAMASVAATVDTGSFEQPYLISSVTNKVTGTPLPSTTQSYLKEVMRAVIANPAGTAYGLHFGPSVYGKTGTAEHGPADMSPNAWFTAVDPSQDVAACALVLDNTPNQPNFGATNAAPEVLSVFDGL